jgi:S1-C subfamily serine protease
MGRLKRVYLCFNSPFMKISAVLYLCLMSFLGKAQFGAQFTTFSDQIKKLKSATVRITIDSLDNMGTGFFYTESGELLTCWHVVEPAFHVKPGQPFRKIYAEFNTGERIELGVPTIIVQDTVFTNQCQVYDFIPLIPVGQNPTRKYPFLAIGNLGEIQDGDDILTCGYPLGIKQQFISQGIVSTKYTDTVFRFKDSMVTNKTPRNQYLLDLTMNSGNSGGAIVKRKGLGEYQVVGIADFIIIPYAQAVSDLLQFTKNSKGDIGLMGISTMKVYGLFAGALSQASNGISGMIPVDYFVGAMNGLISRLKK